LASLDLGKLKIGIEVDNAEAKRELNETKEAVQETSGESITSLDQLKDKLANLKFGDLKQGLSDIWSGLKGGITDMKSFGDMSVLSLGAAATAVAAAAKAIWDLASGCASTAAEISKMSQMASMTTSTYQEWSYVFQQLGIDNDKLVDGVNTLAEQMFETSEEGSAALATLVISLEGMNKEEAFAAVIAALQGIEDDTLKCQLANAIFGESYTELMPLLNSTTEDVNGLIKEANDLGLVMSDDCVKAGTEFTQSQNKLQSQF